MSRPPSARQPEARLPSRRPSPTTLAVANAEQAATSVSREVTFQDGVLLILSYESENIFIFSNLSYEHVLDSALTNFGALRDSRVERNQLRLAVQTKIGATETLVQVTPDTWPAVATRAQVVTVLVQRPSPTPPTQPSPSSRPKLPTYRLASPQRESESSSWPGNPPSPRQTSWHPSYSSPSYPVSSGQPTSSPGRAPPPHPQGHSRQPSTGTNGPSGSHYPYAHVHYIPSAPNTVSATTDVSFIGVRPLNDAELRRERSDASYHADPPKRRWDQIDDASADDRTPYGSGSGAVASSHGSSTRPPFNAPAEQNKDAPRSKRTRAWNPPDHQYSCRRCHRTDSPAWRKGPDGPKTLCNACGLSYAKEAARREAAASATSANAQAHSLQDRPASFAYSSGSAANSNNSRSGRTTGVKTLDGSSVALPAADNAFPGPAAAPEGPPPVAQSSRECTVCRRTDSPQWRKGPEGPNTLCNSCGLSWARTQRKSEGAQSRAASSRSASPVATLKPPTYQPTPSPVSAVIAPGTPLSESHARPAPRSLAEDDEHIRPSSAGSHRSASLENPGGQPSSS